ncbi:MAG TPA: hypothetical protein VNH13_01805 [Candidatus Acidoferrales bacterium]|nr:hypothetical protein [Candidatus Acidoferrales bacterium]
MLQLPFDTTALDPILSMAAVGIVGVIATTWLAAAWWTYADMSRRTTIELARLLAPAWILLSTPVLLPLSLGAYLLARPHRTVADRRAEQLFEAMTGGDELERCPWCAGRIDAAWRRCPACATWLAAQCQHCGGWSSTLFEICPLCAAEVEPRGLGATAPSMPAALPAAPPPFGAGVSAPDMATRGLDVGRGLPRPAGSGSLRRAGP